MRPPRLHGTIGTGSLPSSSGASPANVAGGPSGGPSGSVATATASSAPLSNGPLRSSAKVAPPARVSRPYAASGRPSAVSMRRSAWVAGSTTAISSMASRARTRQRPAPAGATVPPAARKPGSANAYEAIAASVRCVSVASSTSSGSATSLSENVHSRVPSNHVPPQTPATQRRTSR